MRKINQEIFEPEVVDSILNGASVCRIAMIDNDLPYIVPMNYGYKNNCIYMHSALVGKKIDLLRNNTKVCFEIEQKGEIVPDEKACNWATSYRSIIGYGKVEFISNAQQKRDALTVIMKHNGARNQIIFDDKQVENVLVLKLKIESLTAKQSSNWGANNAIHLVNFESDRLSFKELDEADLDNIHRLHSMAEVDEFNTLGIPESIDNTIAIVKAAIDQKGEIPRGSYQWCIFEKVSMKFMGMAGLFLSNDKFKLGEIYYKFFPEFWGNGYATETSKRLIELGFTTFKLHKVEAGVAIENHRSIKVLEKSGMIREGRRFKILPIRGEWVDNYHYAIVNSNA